MTKSNNLYKINSHPKYRSYGGGNTRTYTSNKSTGTLGFQEVEVGNMSTDYITRPEFEQHQKHMDTRFDAIEDKVDLNKQILSKEIKEAVSSLKEEINNKKITTNRFWIGISVPTIMSIIGILINFFK